jgi:predicted homoserine dehydrogenase-like protein
MGVYVTFEAANEYVQCCFNEYWLLPDETGRYAGLYRPTHMIGLELGISVASGVLRAEATGSPTGWQADVIATTKRDLAAGEVLDGEGGCMAWGKILPAANALARNGLPLGLTHGVRLIRPIARGRIVTWADLDIDPKDPTVAFCREMEAAIAPGAPGQPA